MPFDCSPSFVIIIFCHLFSEVTGNSCQLCGLGVAMEASQPSDDDSVEEVPLSNRFRAPAHWLNIYKSILFCEYQNFTFIIGSWFNGIPTSCPSWYVCNEVFYLGVLLSAPPVASPPIRTSSATPPSAKAVGSRPLPALPKVSAPGFRYQGQGCNGTLCHDICLYYLSRIFTHDQ